MTLLLTYTNQNKYDTPLLNCEYCSKKFKEIKRIKKNKIYNHILRFHINNLIICDICYRYYTTHETLTRKKTILTEKQIKTKIYYQKNRIKNIEKSHRNYLREQEKTKILKTYTPKQLLELIQFYNM